jgi:hypothetical protein
MGIHGNIAPIPPAMRPLPSHKSQSGHATLFFGGLDANDGDTDDNNSDFKVGSDDADTDVVDDGEDDSEFS